MNAQMTDAVPIVPAAGLVISGGLNPRTRQSLAWEYATSAPINRCAYNLGRFRFLAKHD